MGHVYNVLANTKITPAPHYFNRRLIVEQCENIHIHWRNLRIELTDREYTQFCNVMMDSLNKYYETITEKVTHIPIDKIDPFDPGHRKNGDTFDCGKKQQEHVDGVDYIKRMLRENKKILPVAVFKTEDGRYKRLDGFKRFWAYKELGYEHVKCAVMKYDVPGVQRGLSPILEDE